MMKENLLLLSDY